VTHDRERIAAKLVMATQQLLRASCLLSARQASFRPSAGALQQPAGRSAQQGHRAIVATQQSPSGAGMYVDIPPIMLPHSIRMLLPQTDFNCSGANVPAHALLPSVSDSDSSTCLGSKGVTLPERHYTEGPGVIQGRHAVIKTASLDSHPFAAEEVLREVSRILENLIIHMVVPTIASTV
jgi:hypothetical protein